MNLAELLMIPAGSFPDQEIITFEGRRTSYETLQDEVSRLAGALRRLGVQAGDRVAVMDTNSSAVIEVMYAATALGAIYVPLNYRARPDELSHMLSVSSPKVVFAGVRYLSAVADAAKKAETVLQVVALEPAGGSVPDLAGLIRDAEPAFPEDAAETDMAVLMFTSGTTAAAKAVMLTHGALTGFVLNGTELADGSDRGAVLLAAPLYHIAGLTASLTATWTGRRMVLLHQFEAEEWLGTIQRERVSHAFLVPTMVKRVLDHPAFSSTDFSSLQLLSYGAAPMPLGVIRRAIEQFPPSVQFINAFGQTETTSTVAMLGPDDHRLDGTPEDVERKLRRLASIGRPMPDVELLILDEQGEPVPQGVIGEIAIRSGRVMSGYYRQQEATSTALQGDGVLRTRDLGWIDEDGYVFLAGRKSDMIIRGGENIAPEEVEVVLESHPAVEEAAVIGLPDQEWGERVGAVVVPRPGAQVSAATLVEFCRQRLASFKKPEAVFFSDALPRNALGKVLRKDLRAQYASAAVNGGMDGQPNR